MKAVLFVEIEGIKYFKCDTFWSKSDKPGNAKIYSNDTMSSLEGWLHPVISGHIYKYKKETIDESIDNWKTDIKRYNNAKLGYFTPTEDLYKNSFVLKEGTQVDELGKPTYLWSIRIKDESEWSIKSKDDKSASFDTGSIREFINYKQTHREEMISNLLKEKDPE